MKSLAILFILPPSVSNIFQNNLHRVVSRRANKQAEAKLQANFSLMIEILRFVVKSAEEVLIMEVTINLPDRIFANLSSVADKSSRRIDEVIVEKIERDFAIDAGELEKQISFCADGEIFELAKLRMPPQQDERLSFLLQKQGEQDLPAAEQKELWELMESNRLTTLKKAFALREIARRGLNGED